MNFVRETLLVWSHEAKRAFLSARFIALLSLYLLFTLVSGLAVHGCSSAVQERIQEQREAIGTQTPESDELIDSKLGEGRREVVKKFFTKDDDTFTDSIAWMPLPLLFLFELGMYFLPLYITLLGFDQISSEFVPRSLRFLTVRARRESIVVGRFLSQLTLLWGLVLLVVCLQVAYGIYSSPELTAPQIAEMFGRLLLKSWVFTIPYVALSTLCSSVARTSPVALLLNFISLFVFWLASVLSFGRGSEERAMTWLTDGINHASIWYYRQDLLHPDALRLSASIGVHLLFAAIFLGGAIFTLRTRDV